jgi:hypothetical protein
VVKRTRIEISLSGRNLSAGCYADDFLSSVISLFGPSDGITIYAQSYAAKGMYAVGLE